MLRKATVTDAMPISAPTIADFRDPRLPGLSLLLDPEAMKNTFAESFFEQAAGQSDDRLQCRLLSAWYSPGKQCHALYEITWPDRADRRLLVAHTNSARGHHPLPRLLRTAGVQHIARQGVWLWGFPNDPALPWLACLTDSDTLKSVIPYAIGATSREYHVEVLRYAPLKRCALRLALSSTTQEPQEVLVAKIDVNGAPAKAHAVMTQLWEHRLRGDRRYEVAEPLGDSPAGGFLWQRWCPGERFADAAKRLGLLRATRLAAEALADLHQAPIEGLSRRTAAEDQAKLTHRARVLAEFHPSLTEPVRRVASRLAESAIFSDSSVVVPLHGDFNDGQLLIHHERPIVLDFDACALGDPHYDLGHFIAGLYRLVRSGIVSESDLRSAEAEFRDTYQSNVPWHVSRTRLEHVVALALICRRAHKALRRLEPGAVESIRTYVAHAEAHLG